MEMIDSVSDIAMQLQDLLNKNLKLHICNIFRQYSELKYLKQNLKINEVVLSVDFSRNYNNKQKHDIQSAYFGHEAFTIYTEACYSKECINDQSETDLDSGLHVLSVAIVSNERVHERNIGIACNLKLLQVVQRQLKHIKTVMGQMGALLNSVHNIYLDHYYSSGIMVKHIISKAHMVVLGVALKGKSTKMY